MSGVSKKVLMAYKKRCENADSLREYLSGDSWEAKEEGYLKLISGTHYLVKINKKRFTLNTAVVTKHGIETFNVTTFTLSDDESIKEFKNTIERFSSNVV